MKSIMIFVKLLFLGALFIVSNHNLALIDGNDRAVFYDMFYDWTGTLFDKFTELTGYFVKSEWLPEVNNSLESELERIKE